jgi:hypothetical protein
MSVCTSSQHENGLHCACALRTHTPPHTPTHSPRSRNGTKMDCIALARCTHTPPAQAAGVWMKRETIGAKPRSPRESAGNPRIRLTPRPARLQFSNRVARNVVRRARALHACVLVVACGEGGPSERRWSHCVAITRGGCVRRSRRAAVGRSRKLRRRPRRVSSRGLPFCWPVVTSSPPVGRA